MMLPFAHFPSDEEIERVWDSAPDGSRINLQTDGSWLAYVQPPHGPPYIVHCDGSVELVRLNG